MYESTICGSTSIASPVAKSATYVAVKKANPNNVRVTGEYLAGHKPIIIVSAGGPERAVETRAHLLLWLERKAWRGSFELAAIPHPDPAT